MDNFMLKYRNARRVINQIRSGEWVVRVNRIDGQVYTAERDGRVLWLANGPFFCELTCKESYKETPAFGLLFRHMVWWLAARNLKSQRHKRIKPETPIL